MRTEQSEDTEQTIEHGRRSAQKGMQQCLGHGGGRLEYPGISPLEL